MVDPVLVFFDFYAELVFPPIKKVPAPHADA